MSASIYAEPVDRKKDYLPIDTPSAFMGSLEKVFGTRLPELGPEDIPKLEAIFAIGNHDKDALDILIRLIHDHGQIQLSAEY